MKLRSAQFVLLVLLFSSLSLSEGSTLRLADELIGSGSMLLQVTSARPAIVAQPSSSVTSGPTAGHRITPASRDTLARTWPMPHPAARSAAIQATTANARA